MTTKTNIWISMVALFAVVAGFWAWTVIPHPSSKDWRLVQAFDRPVWVFEASYSTEPYLGTPPPHPTFQLGVSRLDFHTGIDLSGEVKPPVPGTDTHRSKRPTLAMSRDGNHIVVTADQTLCEMNYEVDLVHQIRLGTINKAWATAHFGHFLAYKQDAVFFNIVFDDASHEQVVVAWNREQPTNVAKAITIPDSWNALVPTSSTIIYSGSPLARIDLEKGTYQLIANLHSVDYIDYHPDHGLLLSGGLTRPIDSMIGVIDPVSGEHKKIASGLYAAWAADGHVYYIGPEGDLRCCNADGTSDTRVLAHRGRRKSLYGMLSSGSLIMGRNGTVVAADIGVPVLVDISRHEYRIVVDFPFHEGQVALWDSSSLH